MACLARNLRLHTAPLPTDRCLPPYLMQVLLGVRQAEVKDYEIMHSWRRVKSDLVEGRQRSCLYLQPQEPGFFKAGGRAVAVYDYSFTMKRNAAPDDAPRGAVACVPTPKDVVQCV